MPLLVFQSRQLLSEIGTAAGAALTLYGFVALGTKHRLWIVDSFVALAALAAGITLGFLSGGALLGVLVPVGAYAVAHGLGASLWMRIADIAIVGVRGRRRGASGLDRGDVLGPHDDGRPSLAVQIKAVLATAVVVGVACWLAYEVFSLVQPQPGLNPPQRAMFGKAIVASGCWSPALGGLWRPEDDLRYSFDSTFEQIAYGTFPWGILGPIAMAALLASPEPRRRVLGALSLAWAGGAWVAAEVFQRKVGFTLWAGFPALAIAIGTWLDGVLTDRRKEPGAPESVAAGAVLVGFFVVLAVVDLGKDLQSFPERISSLLVGSDQVAYPKMSRLLFLPTKLWLLGLGAAVAFAFAFALGLWRDDPAAKRRRKISRVSTAIALGGTALFAAFWSFGWLPALATHLSSKSMFDTYHELRKQGDQLVIMGEMGDATAAYAPESKPEIVGTRDQIVAAIARKNRVFAIAPQTELCQLHREIGGNPYYVVDDRNTRSLLLSNRLDGTTDKNPLRTAILHAEPKNIPTRPNKRIVFDNRIEVLGWDIPKRAGRGDKVTVTMFYKILQPVGGNWRVLFHFDGSLRFNGDHEPIKGRCQTSTWQPGDYIVDTHTVTAGGGAFAPGTYEVWTGFFTGSNPNWKNMPVSEASPELRDTTDRVKITTIKLD
jgi:hypothetical protein